MSEQNKLVKELKKAVSKELNDCCNKNHLPRLQKFIETPEGLERAESVLFEMCATDGIAVQTAMSQFESELGNEEYNV